MKLIDLGLLAILALPLATFGETEEFRGVPVNYISSCQIDLTGDGLNDIAILMESQTGRELVILCGSRDGYRVGIVKRDIEGMYMSCEFDLTLSGIYDNDSTDTKVEVTTSGSYVQLYAPEGASLSIFWSNGEFKEIWTSD